MSDYVVSFLIHAVDMLGNKVVRSLSAMTAISTLFVELILSWNHSMKAEPWLIGIFPRRFNKSLPNWT